MEKKIKEVRIVDVNLECKSVSDDNKMIIEGYATVFESPATHGYTEIIDKNAFNVCDMRDVLFRYNHSENIPLIARTRNNSLKINIDDKGLFFRAELIDTQNNKDFYKSVSAGLIDKTSFSFTVNKQEWDYETDTRRILEIDKLFDVSIVDVPFYDKTEVYARSLEKYEEEKEKYTKEKLSLEKEKLKLFLSI